MFLRFSPTIICCILIAPRLWAHGDLHEQIGRITEQIQASPSSELYLKRGELHRLHEEFSLALADFNRAQKLTPDLTLEFLRAQTFADAQKRSDARECLDRFLQKYPNHIEARVLRARVLVKLNEPESAVRDFTQAIADSKEPQPELFLERSEALTGMGESKFREALDGLDDGIKHLGPLVTLQLAAVELDLRCKNYKSALDRIDALSAQSPRKEMWLERKAEVLLRSKNRDAARKNFQSALQAIEKLPPRLRETESTQQLKARAENGLQQCSDIQTPAKGPSF